MKFVHEDHGRARVYYRDAARKLFCYQEDVRDHFTLYVCSRDGEPSCPVTSLTVPLPPGETSTGRKLREFLKRREHAYRQAFEAGWLP